jgi:biopolymer transport protein ExbD
MTPMIDVVFQLLTFFLFSFRIASVEGDFNIKMPLAGPGRPSVESPQLPINVRLKASADGSLAGIQLGDKRVGSFKDLQKEILSIVGNPAGPSSAAADAEVELNCDYNLKYKYVVDAITAVSGYLNPEDRSIVRLIQKIKFSPPKKK